MTKKKKRAKKYEKPLTVDAKFIDLINASVAPEKKPTKKK
jgi:hypothetical protein